MKATVQWHQGVLHVCRTPKYAKNLEVCVATEVPTPGKFYADHQANLVPSPLGREKLDIFG